MGVISDVLLAGLRENGRKPGRKLNLKGKDTSEVGVLKSALLAGLVMVVLALTQMLLTMYYPVSPFTNPVSVYIRNIAMFLAIGTTGLFLVTWFNFVTDEEFEYTKKNGIRFVAILAIIFCLVKGLYSLYVVYYQFYKGFYLITRYTTDGIAWVAMAVFIIVYFRNVLGWKNRIVDLKKYKVFCIVITVICCLQTCSAIQYTIMKYTPYYAIWTYYLATAVAWFLLSMFFSFYCSSKLVMLPEGYRGEKKMDPALEAAMEKAAKS